METKSIANHSDVSGAQGLQRLKSCDVSRYCDLCGGVTFVHPRLQLLQRLWVQQTPK